MCFFQVKEYNSTHRILNVTVSHFEMSKWPTLKHLRYASSHFSMNNSVSTQISILDIITSLQSSNNIEIALSRKITLNSRKGYHTERMFQKLLNRINGTLESNSIKIEILKSRKIGSFKKRFEQIVRYFIVRNIERLQLTWRQRQIKRRRNWISW